MVGSASSNNTTAPICFSIHSPPFKYNHTIAYFSAIFSGVGLSSNLFAFIVLIKAYQRAQSRSRCSFLIFLSGLVVTDFMGLLVTGSIVVSFHATRFNWRELDPHCHFCNFMGMSMVFYGLCPLLLGASMAVERFMGINQPFSRSTNMSKSRALLTVVMVWVFAGCISLLPLGGLGSYHMQVPGSWCFINISSKPLDLIFCLIFSLVGLLSLAVSFLLNTVSVVTLLRVCCGQEAMQRRRNHELNMMGQLTCIMIITSICWCPLLIFILKCALSAETVDLDLLLLFLRLACLNQICDPWIYILCQLSCLRQVTSLHKSRTPLLRLRSWNATRTTDRS
ncbi:thromboxane A2 receptor-like [Megalops cyprinoides]|uniref:thromboxane A2 receptor-like n=1 Tax=Megalops cyprinoides TaxID=118141 RepID=UPI001863F06A|nr:thromboxane A2 receptor-like [Megalops cyprinoides]